MEKYEYIVNVILRNIADCEAPFFRDSALFSVFYEDGEEANDYYLTLGEAVELAIYLEEKENTIIIAEFSCGEWIVVYETRA